MSTRTFARVYGIAFLLIGIAGFIPGLNRMHEGGHPALSVDAFSGHLFGLFHVNLLHNLVHIAFGIWGLAAAGRYDSARTYARGVAITYLLFVVMGLLPERIATTFGLVPLWGHDVWLHVLLALPAAYFGFVKPATDDMRTDEYSTAGTAHTTGTTTGLLADDDTEAGTVRR